MIHILGSLSEDLYWTTYRFVNPKIKTVYAPTFKLLIAEHDVTNIIGREYTFSKTVKFAAKMQSRAITEEEQVLMRGICCLASGELQA